MSGVLHPAGPEPTQTYWLRRALVLLALLILVLVSVGVAGASMGATRQTAPPAVAPSSDSPSDASTASASTTPSTTSSASPNAAPGSTASANPTGSTSPSSSSSPSTAESGGSGGAAELAPTCQRKDLKVTMSGKQMLKLNKPAAFTITVRNDGDETCRLSLARTDFELKITTGKAMLWSSRVCNNAIFVVAAKLELDQAMSWSMLWDGRGVAPGCVQPGVVLKRGTYLATATLTGAKPAELPVTLRP